MYPWLAWRSFSFKVNVVQYLKWPEFCFLLVFENDSLVSLKQSLEFVVEMRILAGMKIENRGKKFFVEKKIDKHTFFSMKIKMIIYECKLKVQNWY